MESQFTHWNYCNIFTKNCQEKICAILSLLCYFENEKVIVHKMYFIFFRIRDIIREIIENGGTLILEKYKSISLEQMNQCASDSTKILEANEKFLQTIQETAEKIHNHPKACKIILLAGPSGSGKTTTAFLLERALDALGHSTSTLSMDNFFSTMTEEQKKLNELGKLDLETPNRLDRECLNRVLSDIMQGKETWIPRYDFPTMTQIPEYVKFQPVEHQCLILEGIHALNPDVITLPDDCTSRIYVSVRTRIVQDDIVLHPSRLRLARRMLRDSLYRKRLLSDTIRMFEKVQAGEHKYINPYKPRAPYHIDTFLPYEMGVYRSQLGENLEKLFDHPMLSEFAQFWDGIAPIALENIPEDSLVREFAGGSIFQY